MCKILNLMRTFIESNNRELDKITNTFKIQIHDFGKCNLFISTIKYDTKTLYKLNYKNKVLLETEANIKFSKNTDTKDIVQQHIDFLENKIHSNCIANSTNQIYNLTTIWEYESNLELIKFLKSLIK